MAELVDAGKVRYLGLSEAGRRDAPPRRTPSIRSPRCRREYSLWTRDPEDGVLADLPRARHRLRRLQPARPRLPDRRDPAARGLRRRRLPPPSARASREKTSSRTSTSSRACTSSPRRKRLHAVAARARLGARARRRHRADSRDQAAKLPRGERPRARHRALCRGSPQDRRGRAQGRGGGDTLSGADDAMAESLNDERRPRRQRSRWRAVDPFSCYSHLLGVGAVDRRIGRPGGDLARRSVARRRLLDLRREPRPPLSREHRVPLAAGTDRTAQMAEPRRSRGDLPADRRHLHAGLYRHAARRLRAGRCSESCGRPPSRGRSSKLSASGRCRAGSRRRSTSRWAGPRCSRSVPLVRASRPSALAWLLAGGLLYTAGAVVYATRRPNPYPRVFGFHEIFHIFVLAGSVAHFVFMLRCGRGLVSALKRRSRETATDRPSAQRMTCAGAYSRPFSQGSPRHRIWHTDCLISPNEGAFGVLSFEARILRLVPLPVRRLATRATRPRGGA